MAMMMMIYTVAFWTFLLIANLHGQDDGLDLKTTLIEDDKLSHSEAKEAENEQEENDEIFVFTPKQKLYIERLNPKIPEKCHHPLRTRKEIRLMSREEWKNFIEAVKALKTTMIDGISQYHLLVRQHGENVSPEAHGGPSFYPYHREYLFRFENGLREHRPHAYLPYWDPTPDSKLPFPPDSIMWTKELMGNRQGIVTSGPFAYWTVIPKCDKDGSGLLRRDMLNGTKDSDNRLYNDTDIETALAGNSFQDFYNSPFEDVHSGIHVLIGGQLEDTCSPSDPLLFIYHAFIDYVWETYRQTSQKTPLTEYNFEGKRTSEYHPDSPLEPFLPLKNRDGLSTYYTRCFYNYEVRRNICATHSDCNNMDFLFCHRGKCVSKVIPGGNCTGLPDIACHQSRKCINDRCH